MMNPNPTITAAPNESRTTTTHPPAEPPPPMPVNAASALALAHAQVSEKFPNPKRQKLNSLSAAIGLGVNVNVANSAAGVGVRGGGGAVECLTTVRSSLSANSAFRSSPSSVSSSPSTTTSSTSTSLSSSSSSLSRFLSNAVSNHLPPPPPQLQHHQHYNSVSPSHNHHQTGSNNSFNQHQHQQPQQKPQERQWTIVKNTASQSTSSLPMSTASVATTSPSSAGGGSNGQQLNHLRISLQSSPSSSSSLATTTNTTTATDLRAKSLVQQNSALRKTESAPLRAAPPSPKPFPSPQQQSKVSSSPLTTATSSISSSVMNRSFSESSAAMLSSVVSSSSSSSSSPSTNPKSFQPSPSAAAAAAPPPSNTRITPTITPVVKETPRMPPTAASQQQRSLVDSTTLQSSSKEPSNTKLLKSLSQPPQQPQLLQLEQATTPVVAVPAPRTSPTNSHSQPPLSAPPTVVQQAAPPRKSFACLRNLGSTCYINCIIQVMRYTPGFVLSIHKLHRQIEYLKSMNMDLENEINCNNDTIFVKNLHELLCEMSEKEKLDRRPVYSPRKFVNTVWTSLSFWSDGSQQDAHEFLQYTIHFINECDIFIRKLQQQYQLKQLPLNDSILFAAPVVMTTAASSQPKAMNPPVSAGGRASARNRSSQALTTGQATTTAPVATVNKRSSANSNAKSELVKCKSSSNTLSLTTVVSRNHHLTTSPQTTSETPMDTNPPIPSIKISAVAKAPYSIHVCKSMPAMMNQAMQQQGSTCPVANIFNDPPGARMPMPGGGVIINNNNLVIDDVNYWQTTPTKGGASAFDLSAIDLLSSSSSSTCSEPPPSRPMAVAVANAGSQAQRIDPTVPNNTSNVTNRRNLAASRTTTTTTSVVQQTPQQCELHQAGSRRPTKQSRKPAMTRRRPLPSAPASDSVPLPGIKERLASSSSSSLVRNDEDDNDNDDDCYMFRDDDNEDDYLCFDRKSSTKSDKGPPRSFSTAAAETKLNTSLRSSDNSGVKKSELFFGAYTVDGGLKKPPASREQDDLSEDEEPNNVFSDTDIDVDVDVDDQEGDAHQGGEENDVDLVFSPLVVKENNNDDNAYDFDEMKERAAAATGCVVRRSFKMMTTTTTNTTRYDEYGEADEEELTEDQKELIRHLSEEPIESGGGGGNLLIQGAVLKRVNSDADQNHQHHQAQSNNNEPMNYNDDSSIIIIDSDQETTNAGDDYQPHKTNIQIGANVVTDGGGGCGGSGEWSSSFRPVSNSIITCCYSVDDSRSADLSNSVSNSNDNDKCSTATTTTDFSSSTSTTNTNTFFNPSSVVSTKRFRAASSLNNKSEPSSSSLGGEEDARQAVVVQVKKESAQLGVSLKLEPTTQSQESAKAEAVETTASQETIKSSQETPIEPVAAAAPARPGRPAKGSNLKKFKSKSKTFPQSKGKTAAVEAATADGAASNGVNGGCGSSNSCSAVVESNISSLTAEIDQITAVVAPKPTTTTNSVILNSNGFLTNSINLITNGNSCSSNLRSKLRSSSRNAAAASAVAAAPTTAQQQVPTTSATTTSAVASAAAAAAASAAPPSPAELLRKYSSTTQGYTCEMDKLFKGSSITVTQCLECENLRKCPEAFYDRSIPVDTTSASSVCEDGSSSSSSSGAAAESDWITKCLSNESYLNENSKYRCEICASKQEARIHTQYTQMPNILVLHLLSYGITSSIDGNLNAQKLSNRSRLVSHFNYVSSRDHEDLAASRAALSRPAVNQDHGHGNLSHRMISPIAARKPVMSQAAVAGVVNPPKFSSMTLQTNHEFKLFAVVMHSGVSLNSGHYTAFINYSLVSQRDNSKCLSDTSACYTVTKTTQELIKMSNDSQAAATTSFSTELPAAEEPASSISDSKPPPQAPLSFTSTNTICPCLIDSSICCTGTAKPAVSPLSFKSEPIEPAVTDEQQQQHQQPEWLHFDDTRVKTLTNMEFHRKIIDSSYDSPYILFYVKD